MAYTYDQMDRMISAMKGNAVTMISYDFAGSKTAMDDADMGAWSFGYDGLSQLSKQTDATAKEQPYGCITNLAYDLAGRLTGKTYDLSGCTGMASTTPVATPMMGFFIGSRSIAGLRRSGPR